MGVDFSPRSYLVTFVLQNKFRFFLIPFPYSLHRNHFRMYHDRTQYLFLFPSMASWNCLFPLSMPEMAELVYERVQKRHTCTHIQQITLPRSLTQNHTDTLLLACSHRHAHAHMKPHAYAPTSIRTRRYLTYEHTYLHTYKILDKLILKQATKYEDFRKTVRQTHRLRDTDRQNKKSR